MITHRHAIFDRSPLDQWSAWRRDLYLTTHNTHKRQTSMIPAGFEPAVPSSELPHTHALGRAVYTLICHLSSWATEIHSILPSHFWKKHFNIIFSSTPGFSKWSLSLRSPSPQACMHLCYLLQLAEVMNALNITYTSDWQTFLRAGQKKEKILAGHNYFL